MGERGNGLNRKAGKLSELMWLVLVLLIASLAIQGQESGQVEVEDVKVVLKTTEEDGTKTATFVLLISGRAFGTDSSNIAVTVVSSEGVVRTAEVISVTNGKEIITRITAEPDYEPLTVTVRVGDASSGGFLIEEGEEEDGDPVYIYVSLMDPKNVSDIFGKRIAKRFICWQVTVDNEHKEQKLLIHDLSLDLSKVQPEWSEDAELSSRELSMLRGVAEKGRLNDFRNLLLRILRGAATIAGGLVGVVGFGPSYAGGVAVFSGPVITAYTEAFPDLSHNQLIRLNDSAHITNAVVPQQQSRIVVVFMPQRLLMNNKQRAMFWKEPTSLWDEKETKKRGVDTLDLRKVKGILDYGFIVETADIAPQLTERIIDSEEAAKFEHDSPEVKGYIIGNFLAGSEISLTDDAPEGLSMELAGTPTDKRLHFILKSDRPVKNGTTLTLRVTKGENFQTISTRVNYTPKHPQFSDDEVVNVQELKAKLTAGQGTFKGVLNGEDLDVGTLMIKEDPGSDKLGIKKEDGSTAIELKFVIEVKKKFDEAKLTIVLSTVNDKHTERVIDVSP